MRIELENYNTSSNEDFNPKFAIDWFYYNDKPNDPWMAKRNRYRQRINMPVILDNGRYFYFRFYFGRRIIGIYVTIRDIKIGEKYESQSK